MKQFCCGDVVPGCKATFLANGEQDLFAQIATHALQDHNLQEIPPLLTAQAHPGVNAQLHQA